MCFKKPKLPPKTPEELEAEQELKRMRELRQKQLNQEITEAKERRTEQDIARAMGFFGNRSLISGGRGGSGFIGSNIRPQRSLIARQPNTTRPTAPPIMGISRPLPSNIGSLLGY